MAERIRVVKASNPSYWYANKIGEVFNVREQGNEGYRVRDGRYSVVFRDAEIVEESSDAVAHPSHYTRGKYETIEVIGRVVVGYSDPFVSDCVGTASEYRDRAPYKLEDISEALHASLAYLDFAIEKLGVGGDLFRRITIARPWLAPLSDTEWYGASSGAS